MNEIIKKTIWDNLKIISLIIIFTSTFIILGGNYAIYILDKMNQMTELFFELIRIIIIRLNDYKAIILPFIILWMGWDLLNHIIKKMFGGIYG